MSSTASSPRPCSGLGPSPTDILRHLRRLKRGALAGLAGLAFALAQGPTPVQAEAAPDTASLSELVDFFDTVVFGREGGANGNRAQRLLKWPGDSIVFGVAEYDGGSHGWRALAAGGTPEFGRVLDTLHGLALHTGLKPVSAPVSGRKLQLTVIFTGLRHLARIPIPGLSAERQRVLAGPGRCYFVVSASTSGTLDRGYVAVNRDRPEADVRHCLLEELTQVMGLPNDTGRLRPSIFSELDQLTSLSVNDAMILRALYHESLIPGMDRQAVLNRLPGILETLDTP